MNLQLLSQCLKEQNSIELKQQMLAHLRHRDRTKQELEQIFRTALKQAEQHNNGFAFYILFLFVDSEDLNWSAPPDYAVESQHLGNAFCLAKKSWEAGCQFGLVAMAEFFHFGGVDLTKAIQLYLQAIELGSTDAMARLGFLQIENYYNPDNESFEANKERGINLCKRAALAGNSIAMNSLGNIYEDDLPEVSQAWYENAAKLKDPMALHNLGYYCSKVTRERKRGSWLIYQAYKLRNAYAEMHLNSDHYVEDMLQIQNDANTLLLLLCGRKFVARCCLSDQFLPLDLFKLIVQHANILFVI